MFISRRGLYPKPTKVQLLPNGGLPGGLFFLFSSYFSLPLFTFKTRVNT